MSEGLLIVLLIFVGFISVLLLNMSRDIIKTKLLLEALVTYTLHVDAVWYYGEELKKTDAYMVLAKLLEYSKES